MNPLPKIINATPYNTEDLTRIVTLCWTAPQASTASIDVLIFKVVNTPSLNPSYPVGRFGATPIIQVASPERLYDSELEAIAGHDIAPAAFSQGLVDRCITLFRLPSNWSCQPGLVRIGTAPTKAVKSEALKATKMLELRAAQEVANKNAKNAVKYLRRSIASVKRIRALKSAPGGDNWQTMMELASELVHVLQ